jgi:threonine/homoserine/homoserine lactone efflux protein
VAAHVALWTGLGLSLTTAAFLRQLLMLLCVAALIYLAVKRRDRIETVFRYFKKETQPCRIE